MLTVFSRQVYNLFPFLSILYHVTTYFTFSLLIHLPLHLFCWIGYMAIFRLEKIDIHSILEKPSMIIASSNSRIAFVVYCHRHLSTYSAKSEHYRPFRFIQFNKQCDKLCE